MEKKIFYEQQKTCPVCGGSFNVTRVRHTSCPVLKHDDDFCVHYQGVNPYFYDVWVCPHCGYASPEHVFTEIGDKERRLLQQAFKGIEVKMDFAGERDVHKAIASFKLAIYCGEVRQLKSSTLAGMYLKTAWLYRSIGDSSEKEYLAKARECYEKAFNTERLPIGKMNEITMQYLIGELYRRTGEYKEAIQWFGRVINNPQRVQEPRIVAQAREQWRLAKAALSGLPQPDEGTIRQGPRGSQPAAAVVHRRTVKPEPTGKPRMKVSTMVTIYSDQLAWIKQVASQEGVGLDHQGVIRAVLDCVLRIDPSALRGQNESELKEVLTQTLKTSGGEGKQDASCTG